VIPVLSTASFRCTVDMEVKLHTFLTLALDECEVSKTHKALHYQWHVHHRG